MDKSIVFNFAKKVINSDVIMYHETKKGEYIFFNSKRHCVGWCCKNDILIWTRTNYNFSNR